MRKVVLYVYIFSKNLIQQLDSKVIRILSFFFLAFTITLVPVLLAVFTYPFLKDYKGFFLLLPLALTLLDIDKSVKRIKYSSDMKQLHHMKFSLYQYVIAKDLSKFYNSLVFIIFFMISFFTLSITSVA